MCDLTVNLQTPQALNRCIRYLVVAEAQEQDVYHWQLEIQCWNWQGAIAVTKSWNVGVMGAIAQAKIWRLGVSGAIAKAKSANVGVLGAIATLTRGYNASTLSKRDRQLSIRELTHDDCNCDTHQSN